MGVLLRYRKLFALTLLLGMFMALLGSLVSSSPAAAAAGINEQITFQGRLLNAQGATVPDGNYNIQFKVYQDGDGQTVGNTTGSPAGTLKWTENHLNVNSQGVQVKNGFMSVQLGSVTAFGSSVDWNQDTIWLSMNIGNTNTTCTPFTSCSPDGEMTPMKRLSSTPFSLNSARLGGLTSSQFIQSTTSPQSANIAVQSASASSVAALIQGASSQTADVLQVKADGASDPLMKVAASGAVTLQNTSDSATAFSVLRSNDELVLGVDTSNKLVRVVTGAVNDATLASGTGALQIGADNTYNLAIDDNEIIARNNGAAATLHLQKFGGGLNINANSTIVKPSSNSAAAFQVQKSDSTPLFTVDTTNNLVVMSTPTFQTAATQTCDGSVNPCTITSTNIDSNGAVSINASAANLTINMPDPTNATAGRVVYVTAASGSQDFTLSVNGGGIGNLVSMRQNTTATMIWNGTDWTAAGASSSTTLQSAYDNTLQSAGGAELVVSKTSTTNGLTIRDSSTSPVNGTLLSVQTSSAAGLFSVNSDVTEYTSNSGAEAAGNSATTFPASTWSSIGSATVSRHNTAGNYIPTGKASVSVVTTTAANDGVKNTLTSALTANTTYNVSFTARLTSGAFTDLSVYYSSNGTDASVACANAKAVNTSIWTKINCTFTAPSSSITGSNAMLIRQTSSGTARTFYIDNLSVTIAADYNYATDGSVSDGTNFTTNWSNVSGSTVTRSTSAGYDASDSAQAVTTGTGQGVRNKLAINPLPATLYRITARAASTTSGFDNLTIRYSRDGGTNFVNCADYNTQTVSSSVTDFTEVTCYVTTDSTAASNPYVYFTQTDATGRTFYIDAFSMTLSAHTTPNVQIGGGSNGGPTTLLTLDRGASAPIASNNDALLGSMYYDTTLGKLQCYEADGWGACGSSPDNVVTISPEYTNAVLHGTGVGTMTSDICSGTLDINDGSSGQQSICGTNETYNFYKWTSPQASAQTYSIYVTYELPSTFKSFASGKTSIMGRTDNSNSTVNYQIYRNDSSGLTACGSSVSVSTGSVSSWQTGTASGAADPSTCSFSAGNSIVFKINVTASQNANAYVGNLNFTFNNR